MRRIRLDSDPGADLRGSLVSAKVATEVVTLSTASQFAPETLKPLGSQGLAPWPPGAAPALPTRPGAGRLPGAEQKEPVDSRPQARAPAIEGIAVAADGISDRLFLARF